MEVLKRRYASRYGGTWSIPGRGFQRAEPPDDPTIERNDLCRKDVKVCAAARNLRGGGHVSTPLASLAGSDLKIRIQEVRTTWIETTVTIERLQE